jgi:hypothetical protein
VASLPLKRVIHSCTRGSRKKRRVQLWVTLGVI